MFLLLMACAPGAWFSTDSAIAFDVADLGWVTSESTTPGAEGSLFQLVLVESGSACDALSADTQPDGSLHVWGVFPEPLGLRGSSWANGGGSLMSGGVCDPVQTSSGELDLNFLDEDQGIAAGEMWGSFTAGTFSVVFDANRCDVDAQAVPTC